MFAVCTLYFLLSWLPKLLVNEGFTTQYSRQAFTIFNFGGVIGIFLLGAMATRWSLSLMVSLFLFSTMLLMVGFSFINTYPMAILLVVAIIGMLMQGGFTGLYAIAAKLYSSDIRSTGVGWAIGLGRLGAVFGPAIAGYLISNDISIDASFKLFAIPVLIASLGILSLKIR